MLYVFCGNDTELGGKKIQATIKDLQKKRPNAEFFRVEGRKLDKAFFDEFTFSQGLFEKKYIVEIQYPFETADSRDLFLDNLDSLSESENVFLVIEGNILKKELDLIEKKASKVFINKKVVKKEWGFNTFSIGEAVAKGDRKLAWINFRKAMSQDISCEEVHGVIWWQIKTVYSTYITNSGDELGIKEGSFTKAKRFAGKLSKENVLKMLEELLHMYHRAHQGKIDFELALEKFILSI